MPAGARLLLENDKRLFYPLKRADHRHTVKEPAQKLSTTSLTSHDVLAMAAEVRAFTEPPSSPGPPDHQRICASMAS